MGPLPSPTFDKLPNVHAVRRLSTNLLKGALNMSPKKSLSEIPAVPAAAEQALPPEAIVEQLRALRAHIPEYGQLSPAQVRVLHRTARVDADFSQATVNALGASDSVRSALGRTPEELLQETDAVRRWSAVSDELRAILKGADTANVVRRHRLGLTALQTFSITKQLVRQAEHSDLLPHVQLMKQLNRKRPRKPAKQQTKTQQQPTTPPATTTTAPATTTTPPATTPKV
jgi:hypothetical protein